MDDVLEPADRDEISKKLETSDFANDLIHRTKDTVRRLRLSAPQVVGAGMGLDPNTVAEYLDNTLPPDSVADFERICLESDVHLAEVASCHHVLTMVLGEPAEVDPASRPRMYAIPTQAAEQKKLRIEPAHPSPAGNVFVASAAAPLDPAPPGGYASTIIGSHATGIPDYLRASAWSSYRLPLAVLAATLLLAVTALLTFGLTDWFGGRHELASGSVGQAQAGTEQNASEPSIASEAAEEGIVADEQTSTADDASTTANVGDTANGDGTAPSAGMVGSPLQPLTPGFGSLGTTAEEGDRYASTESAISPPNEPVPNDPIAPYRVAEPAPTAPTESPATTSVPAGVPPAGGPPPIPGRDVGPEIASPSPDTSHSDEVRIASAAGDPAAALSTDNVADVPPPEPPVDSSVELGTYLDAKNILLRHDPLAGAWLRMLPRSTVGVGDKLLALPAFYPGITLTSGIHLKLAGGTLVSLRAADSDSIAGAESPHRLPIVDVEYGKVVIVNTANQEHRLQLALGETMATIHLVPSATLALEVVRSYVPGRDPRQSPAPLVAHLYVPDGSVGWEDDQGNRTIPAPSQWDVAGGVFSAVSTPESFPEWIDSDPVEQRSEQLWGVPVVEQSLDATRPVENQLLELYQGSRRREVKSLAARSSVYVGLFVPFVEALRDSDQSAMWKTHIETLRAAMALGPESADKIYQTLVEQRGVVAARDLYEMLCGYSPEQIGRTPEQVAAGPIPRLIDWLEEDSLDYRVLAVQDLWEVRKKRFLTNPAGSSAERARGVRVWRDRLKSGELNASLE
jgi:hypothetical protein